MVLKPMVSLDLLSLQQEFAVKNILQDLDIDVHTVPELILSFFFFLQNCDSNTDSVKDMPAV